MAESTTLRIEYDIAGDDTVADVRGEWDRFAAENGAPELTAESVIGQRLWDYVAGGDVRSIYRMLVEHVRATGHPKSLDFNCDDAENIRSFRLKIDLARTDTVRFTSTLLELRQRPKVPLFEATVSRSDDDMLTVCSVCKQVDCDGSWLPADKALAKLRLMSNPVMPQISHGLCPMCFEIMERSTN